MARNDLRAGGGLGFGREVPPPTNFKLTGITTIMARRFNIFPLRKLFKVNGKTTNYHKLNFSISFGGDLNPPNIFL